jgi:hypothetical protein
MDVASNRSAQENSVRCHRDRFKEVCLLERIWHGQTFMDMDASWEEVGEPR